MNLGSTGAKSKPALDESSFQQLLAAAFVVQQHNEGLRAKDPAQATSSILSEIAEIQSLVRAGGLEFSAAARLTSERLQKIARADAVRVSLIHEGVSDRIAESGSAFTAVDWLAERSVVSLERLRAGGLIQVSDMRSNTLLKHDGGGSELGSLIAAPIHCFDEFSGVIELRWLRPDAFHGSEARAAQLMAGLISGLLERKLRARRREDVAAPSITLQSMPQAEPAVELVSAAEQDSSAALQEKVGDAAMADQAAFDDLAETDILPGNSRADAAGLPEECRVCGRPFGADEAFCGQCSMPRVAGVPADGLQSKWASLWYMQRAQAQKERAEELLSPPLILDDPPAPVHSENPVQTVQPHAQATEPGVRIWHVPESQFSDRVPKSIFDRFQQEETSELAFRERVRDEITQAGTLVPAAAPDTALHSDPDLLQSTWHTVWARMRRRHATLALTVAGFLLLFLVLAVWPSPQNSQLTWFQSVLVELGLAEVPSHPRVFAGNPDARVWVDLHTALYYCEGSDLYGKTPGGHFSTQHAAQQDEFEPASQVPCR